MSKKYDVLGIGVAAVDDLLYVTDYPPADCKVPVFDSARHGGGPACTAMAAVGSLGGRAAYVARFGSNESSKFIESALNGHNVDISHIVEDPPAAPYYSVIIVDGAGRRTIFYNSALYKTVLPEDLPEGLIQSASLVLLDHITEPALVPVAKKVHDLGVPILGDVEGCTESSKKLAQWIDYLIVPRGWAMWASGAADPRKACATLAGTRRRATVVTDATEGCYCCTDGETEVRHFPAFKVKAYDSTGCGDTFHGAFALAVAWRLTVEDAIVFASAAAALKAVLAGEHHKGWDALPSLDEVSAFLAERIQELGDEQLLNRLRTIKQSLRP